MLPIIDTYLQESWNYTVKSASSWTKWLILYTVIGVGILIAAFKINEFLVIAEVIIVYPLSQILKGKRECDKNAGKYIDKLSDVCRIGAEQEKEEQWYRIEAESERRK